MKWICGKKNRDESQVTQHFLPRSVLLLKGSKNKKSPQKALWTFCIKNFLISSRVLSGLI